MAEERWYKKIANWSSSLFAPPDPVELKKTDLKNALAHVDPSKLLAGWTVTPYNPSWLVTRKGLQIFDSIKRDEQVKAALKFKKDAVLGAGWEVVSPGDQAEDWEVTRFINDALEFIPGGWNAVLTDIMTALDYGYSVAEKMYEEMELGEWKGKLVLSRIQSLKPHHIDFASDQYGVLIGIQQQLTGPISELLPAAKFVIWSYGKEFGNYYGTSDLEAAYRPWWVKDNTYKWLATTLERYGMAPLFAFYDPNVYPGPMVEELKKVVKSIQNATLGVIPRGAPENLEMWSQDLNKGSTEMFFKALDRFDQHIARAVLVPSMIGMSSDDGKTGSLARSGTHADSFIMVVTQVQQALSSAVMNAQVIPQLCDLNFPKLQSYPVFRFVPFTDEKRLEIMATWTAMVAGQIVNKIEDDEVHIRHVLGFPENENPTVIEAQPPPGTNVGPDGKPFLPKVTKDGTPASKDPAVERKLDEEKRRIAMQPKEKGSPIKKSQRVAKNSELTEEMRVITEVYDVVWMVNEDDEFVAMTQDDED